jgi:hypothetical protein
MSDEKLIPKIRRMFYRTVRIVATLMIVWSIVIFAIMALHAWISDENELRFQGLLINSTTFLAMIIIRSNANRELNQLMTAPGSKLLAFSDFFFSNKQFVSVYGPIISDMREEYFEALSQNRIWKARWVRVRGTWSFFAAMGLDRAFAFVSFFMKAWRSAK